MNKSVMMISKSISFTYNEFDNPEELNPDDNELVAAARKSALSAYAPYSRFKVGAALRLESGKIVCGSNVENAAFPSGICAERNALANAVSNWGNDKATAIAVAAFTEEGEVEDPVTPCGNCRQVIAEEESRNGNQIRIILSGKNKIQIVHSISCLLPLHFNSSNLKVNLP
jgi:cytidine deaminase